MFSDTGWPSFSKDVPFFHQKEIRMKNKDFLEPLLTAMAQVLLIVEERLLIPPCFRNCIQNGSHALHSFFFRILVEI